MLPLDSAGGVRQTGPGVDGDSHHTDEKSP